MPYLKWAKPMGRSSRLPSKVEPRKCKQTGPDGAHYISRFPADQQSHQSSPSYPGPWMCWCPHRRGSSRRARRPRRRRTGTRGSRRVRGRAARRGRSRARARRSCKARWRGRGGRGEGAEERQHVDAEEFLEGAGGGGGGEHQKVETVRRPFQLNQAGVSARGEAGVRSQDPWISIRRGDRASCRRHGEGKAIVALASGKGTFSQIIFF